jgi:hypothetical protein
VCPLPTDKLHVKWRFKKEQVQNEESFISRLNVYLETGDGFFCSVFLFNP